MFGSWARHFWTLAGANVSEIGSSRAQTLRNAVYVLALLVLVARRAGEDVFLAWSAH